MSIRLAALLAAVAALAAFGAEVNQSWETMTHAAKPGNRVVITRINTASLEGTLRSIDGASMTIEHAAGTETIPREYVFRVRSGGTRGRHALYGALIGAGAGALTLWAIDRGSSIPHTGEAVGLGIFLGGGAGAIAGVAMPAGTTLYEARTPAKRAD